MTIGLPCEYQQKNKILVSCLAAYMNKIVPPGFERLKESCKKFGIQLTLLGTEHVFQNMYTSKLEFLGDCIYQYREEYDYVINIDAADTMFIAPLEVPCLSCLSNAIMFCGERNEFPLEHLRERFRDNGSSYKFLNAGGFIGSMRMVNYQFAWMKQKRMMAREIKPDQTDGKGITIYNDDQAAWNYEYLEQQTPFNAQYIKIDLACEIFQSLWGVDREKDISYVDGKLRNEEHFTFPLILHANGSANYDDIYQKIVK